MRAAARIAWLAAVAAVAAAGGCADPPEPAASFPPDRGEPAFREIGLPPAFAEALAAAGLEARALDRSGDAWALAEIASDSGSFDVQWADLGRVVVGQVLGPEAQPGRRGLYHPSAPSPSFDLLGSDAVVRQAGDALAVMNGAFFETPGEPSSEIAFPLALDGTVVTGGRSPYGPGRPGAHRRRWGRPLRALGLDTRVHVADYGRQTGVPLGQPGFENAVVSYAPEAHPTTLATRFHVLGAVDADGDGALETLVVVTSDGQTRIAAAAALAARLGAGPDTQIALDGGASVLLWTLRAGFRHQPVPIGGRPQPLPHYLTLTLR